MICSSLRLKLALQVVPLALPGGLFSLTFFFARPPHAADGSRVGGFFFALFLAVSPLRKSQKTAKFELQAHPEPGFSFADRSFEAEKLWLIKLRARVWSESRLYVHRSHFGSR